MDINLPKYATDNSDFVIYTVVMAPNPVLTFIAFNLHHLTEFKAYQYKQKSYPFNIAKLYQTVVSAYLKYMVYKEN